MTLKTTRNILLYSFMFAVLLTLTFQPLQQNNDFTNEEINIEDNLLVKQGLDQKDTSLSMESYLHNYTLYGNYSAVDARDLIVDGDYAYLADGVNGFRILNQTDKTNITEIGFFINGTEIAYSLYVQGDVAYLCYGLNGLVILDITNKISPVVLFTMKDQFGIANCYGIDIDGVFAYLAYGIFGMAIVDITNPSQPLFVGKYHKVDIDVRDVKVYNIYAFIADADYGVHKISISNKENPLRLGGYNSGSAKQIEISITTDYYYAFVADYNGFFILSLYSHPHPTLVYQYSDATHAADVYLEKRTAFVTYEDNIGLRLFNASDVLDVEFAGQYEDTGEGYGLRVEDEYAYILDGAEGIELILLDSDSDELYDGYEITDVLTDPFNPDTDNDTLLDGPEFYGYHAPDNPYATSDYFYGLDPLNIDSDNDTIRDDEEIFLGIDGYRTNPINNDTDADDLEDRYELGGIFYPTSLFANGSGYIFTDPTDVDTDDDQLWDGEEINIYGTDPLNEDTDGDEMPDNYEVDYFLDPLSDDTNSDKDNDGLTNFYEFNVTGTNPNNNDTDDDGLTDGEEVNGYFNDTHTYANGTGWIVTGKPLNSDSDGDGLKDGIEVKFSDSNPLDADSDDDQLSDFDEYITHGTNVNSNDTDNDDLPDYWEVTYGTNPLLIDTFDDPDSDNLTNWQEFQLGTDPHDADTDGDGMPDGWEIDNLFNPLVQDGLSDADNDGLTNTEEFEAGTNPRNPDTDADGLGDEWEIDNGTDPNTDDASDDPDTDGLTNEEEMINETDPYDEDSDDDGLTDGEEVDTYGTDPNNRDTDFDTYSDLEEILEGTDPLDSNSNPRQRLTTILVAIGTSSAVGVLILLTIFFIVYWTTRPEQKMFRFIAKQKSAGLVSLSIKEISVHVDKKLNKGDVKQLVNEFSAVKGLTLVGNKIWLTSREEIEKNIEEYHSWLNQVDSRVITKKALKEISERITNDIKMCEKLQFNDLLSELNKIIVKLD
ncbi:MAG: hypothetical protein E3J70_07945 [Candidatus Heimdallarchaeota archaeon]|nr:MAG: hypothetical protein E3J70_07945 [Candidatus Heimdallarchaeota archaeon]